MRRGLSQVVPVMFLALMLMLALQVKVASPGPAASAQLMYVAGTVFHNPGNHGAWVKAAEGDPVAPGDGIKTGPQSSAIILLWDKSTLRLDEKTQVVLKGFRDPAAGKPTSFYLVVGRIWANVEKALPGNSFQVRSPYSLAAVEGTVFEMDSLGAASGLKVWEGRVRFRHQGRVLEVDSGNAVLSRYQVQLGEALPFDTGRMNPWQQWNREVDRIVAEQWSGLPGELDLSGMLPAQLDALKTLIRTLPTPPWVKVMDGNG